MRLAVVLTAFLVAFLVVGCGNEDEPSSSDLPLIPTPVAPLIRQSCETVAATDYFLSDEERVWYTEECNRLDCDVIRGTQYVSAVERKWYLAECN